MRAAHTVSAGQIQARRRASRAAADVRGGSVVIVLAKSGFSLCKGDSRTGDTTSVTPVFVGTHQ